MIRTSQPSGPRPTNELDQLNVRMQLVRQLADIGAQLDEVPDLEMSAQATIARLRGLYQMRAILLRKLGRVG